MARIVEPIGPYGAPAMPRRSRAWFAIIGLLVTALIHGALVSALLLEHDAHPARSAAAWQTTNAAGRGAEPSR